MTQKSSTIPKPNTLIPAVAISLTGRHLIEASAGTGKTWTLTGIVLRLLIEAKRPPEQIICTTFTRAAAAEMRERILGRLNEFYYLLLWVEKISQQPECQNWLFNLTIDKNPDSTNSNHRQENSEELKKAQHESQKKEFQQIRKNNLLNLARLSGLEIKEIIEDPVNIHLLHYLLDNYSDYPLVMAIRRTQLLLISMDKIFVSTLDSLAQKWLSEYSSETGFQKGMSISDTDEDIVNDIIHDELRKFHAKVYSKTPKLYELLQQTGKLTSVNDHIRSVTKAMNFISSPIDEVSGFNFNNYQMLIEQLIHHEINDVLPYFDEDYKKKKGLSGSKILYKKIHTIKDITNIVKQHKELYLLYLSPDSEKVLKQLLKVVESNERFGFNKNYEKEHHEFINLPTIKLIYELYKESNNLDNEIDKLNHDIVQTVRTRLPIQLEENNKTTFGLQMVRLNQALSGIQGKKLARYIRHHYPVALIDESQDINGEQAKMIQSIYMDNRSSENKSKKKNFLLLVGDPKQAIYGFRGGDVANYNAMKERMRSDAANIMTLNINRRSSAGVIESLNHWFTPDNPKLKALGEGIEYHQIEAFKGDSELSWHVRSSCSDSMTNKILGKKAVSIIHMPYDKDQKTNQYQVIAKHIQYLLMSNETIDGKKIKANDIAILAHKKVSLQNAQWALEKLNIPSVKTAEISVFSSKMSTDLLAILEAIHNPFDTRYVNRALMTTWYGLNLKQIKKLETGINTLLADKVFENSSAEETLENVSEITHSNMYKKEIFKLSYHEFQLILQQAKKRWVDYGVMSALQYLLSDNPFYSQTFNSKNVKRHKITVWEQLAQYREAERYLLDLRQLLELLAHNSRGQEESETIDWLVQQNQKKPTDEASIQHSIPTESGVKLMTIHKSKGLEFPIVYVLGVDNSSKKTNKNIALYPYILPRTMETDNIDLSVQRRLSAVKSDDKYDYQKLVHKDELGEAKRVTYVALTRASQQVYVFLKDKSKNTDLDYTPANIWLESDKEYHLPPRLENYIDWIESSDILNITSTHNLYEKPNTENCINTEVFTQENQNLMSIDYPDYESVIHKRYFVGWSKTSFTALSRQFDKSESDVAISEPDYVFEDMISKDITEPLLNSTGLLPSAETDIRFNFIRGAGAGTFLHQILEKIDFDNPATWSEEIDKGIREYGLPIQYASPQFLDRNQKLALQKSDLNDSTEDTSDQHQQLKSWISDILHMSMLASGERLIDLKSTQRKAELGFDMGLNEGFRAERINEVFAKHLEINGKDSDKLIHLSANNTPHFYRYLRGEIDLVYEYAGKYYIVDYKSNHLGNQISDYTIDNLNMAMSKAGYWLQAVIYQVALHRLLKLRISNYEGNENKYLGAVEYIFLRGCVRDGGMSINLKDQYSQKNNIDHTNSDICYEQNYDMFETVNSYGKVVWDIPIALIKDMDDLFNGNYGI